MMLPETTPETRMAPSASPKMRKRRLFWLLMAPMPSSALTVM